jgi:hypothetical protein
MELEVWEDNAPTLTDTLDTLNDDNVPWTLFWDMHSGGGTKVGNYAKIYVQAPYDEAVDWFTDRYRDPHYVTCECCGPDYSVNEYPTLEKATRFHRERSDYKTAKYNAYRKLGLRPWDDELPDDVRATIPQRYDSVMEYVQRKDVLVIYARDM